MTSSRLGVVIVTYDATDVIFDCIESLLAAHDVALEIVVVDNASTDDTPGALRRWANGTTPYSVWKDAPVPLAAHPKPVALQGPNEAWDGTTSIVTLIEAGANLGFAGGVNLGLKHLAGRADLDRFWVLNPDSVVPPETPAVLAGYHSADGHPFGMLSGRLYYAEDPEVIQNDGGTINSFTGVTGNLGLFQKHATAAPPRADQFDFVCGASMVVSRAFYDQVGPMREDYFLYYEEVDWALRRGDLPIVVCPEAVVYHKAGTAIGSPTQHRPASPLSQYFKHRARMMFMRRFHPLKVPGGIAYGVAKAAQLALKGFRPEAAALLRGTFGRRPPQSVIDRLGPEAIRIALGTSRR